MSIGSKVGHRPPSRKWGSSKRLAVNDVFMGLEIELEHLRNFEAHVHAKPMIDSGLWTITEDHSLRDNGREFIMQEQGTGQPIMGNDVVRALEAFQESMKLLDKAKKPPHLSDRTSIHVHLDVRDLEEEHIDRFALLYYTFEEILFKWIGDDRDKSNYCRTAARNYDVISRTAGLLRANDVPFQNRVGWGNKYDAFNFLAIKGLGTIEVRSMRATTDMDTILQWMNILLRLHEAAQDATITVESFPELVSQGGMKAFLERVFKDQSGVLLPYATDMAILRGVRTAQEIMMLTSQEREGLESAYDSGKANNSRLTKFKQLVLGG